MDVVGKEVESHTRDALERSADIYIYIFIYIVVLFICIKLSNR